MPRHGVGPRPVLSGVQMPNIPARKGSLGLLRAQAEARLASGTAPPNGGTITMEAMAPLFRLACSTETAADGLKLLHELQVHQIELDLQYAQLLANEREALECLNRYKALYELAPAGYLVTDPNGCISQANAEAATLLGIEQDRLIGLMIANVFEPTSGQVFDDLLLQLQAGAARATGVVKQIDTTTLHIVASLTPAGDAMLIVLTAA